MTALAARNPDRNFKYWIIAPAVFLLLAVGLFPLIYSLVVSFMRIDHDGDGHLVCGLL